MLKSRTTLILGAGASAPYDFPIGSALRDQLLLSDDEFVSWIGSTGRDAQEWLHVQDNDPKLGEESLSIITFNYDLSLEAYLVATLKVRHRIMQDEAIPALARRCRFSIFMGTSVRQN
jgi:hypothetical protein